MDSPNSENSRIYSLLEKLWSDLYEEMSNGGVLGAIAVFINRFLFFTRLERLAWLKPIRFILSRLYVNLMLRLASPVFIYQMGKVGSLSIYYSLLRVYPGLVIHGHALSENDHNYSIRRFFQWAVKDKKSAYIISPIREPISRNVSAFFQNFKDEMGVSVSQSGMTIEELRQMFLSKKHTGIIMWFDRRIRPIFDLDVYLKPFSKQGFDTYRSRNINLLILRSELPDSEKENVIKGFLKLRRFSITRANSGVDKEYSGIYSEFMKKVKLPKEYVSRMCESQYFTHFYENEMIEAVRERWSEN